MTRSKYTLDEIEHWQQIAAIIARSHQYINIDIDIEAPLAKKTRNKALLSKLLKLEKEIISKARKANILP